MDAEVKGDQLVAKNNGVVLLRAVMGGDVVAGDLDGECRLPAQLQDFFLDEFSRFKKRAAFLDESLAIFQCLGAYPACPDVALPGLVVHAWQERKAV